MTVVAAANTHRIYSGRYYVAHKVEQILCDAHTTFECIVLSIENRTRMQRLNVLCMGLSVLDMRYCGDE